MTFGLSVSFLFSCSYSDMPSDKEILTENF